MSSVCLHVFCPSGVLCCRCCRCCRFCQFETVSFWNSCWFVRCQRAPPPTGGCEAVWASTVEKKRRVVVIPRWERSKSYFCFFTSEDLTGICTLLEFLFSCQLSFSQYSLLLCCFCLKWIFLNFAFVYIPGFLSFRQL